MGCLVSTCVGQKCQRNGLNIFHDSKVKIQKIWKIGVLNTESGVFIEGDDNLNQGLRDPRSNKRGGKMIEHDRVKSLRPIEEKKVEGGCVSFVEFDKSSN